MAKIKGDEDLLNNNVDYNPIAEAARELNIGRKDGYDYKVEPRLGEFTYTSKYDEGLRAGQSQMAERAEKQSGFLQATNAIFGGAASGIMTAVEDVSYLLDFENHYNFITGADTWEKNWLAELMSEGKEAIDENMPIYRRSTDTFDLGDPAFYWSSVKGIVDSAVGFGLPGGAISKVAGSALRLARVGALMDAIKVGAKGEKFLQAGIAGGIQNYAEGKIMGIEVFEDTYETLTNQGVEEEDAKKFAAQAADEMLLNNRAMIVTDAFSLYGLAAGLKSSRNLLKDPSRSFRNRVKDFGKNVISPNADNLALQGFKEAGEEIAQNAIQMEAKYNAEKAAGLDVSDRSPDQLARLINFATSDQALLEGMMGFFGGGPQRILSEVTSGGFKKSNREALKKRYNEQQATVAENTEFVEGVTSSSSERFKMRDTARSKGESRKADAIEVHEIDKTVLRNIQLGTIEDLEQKANDIKSDPNSTKEQKKSADLVLERINTQEKRYARFSNKANFSQILSNLSNKDATYKFKEQTIASIEETTNSLEEVINSAIIPGYKKTPKLNKDDASFYLTPFTYTLENLEENPYDPKKEKAAYSQYNKFIQRLKKVEEVEELKKLRKDLDGINLKIKENREEYEKITDKKAEQEYVKNADDIANYAKAKDEFIKNTEEFVTNNTNPVPGKVYQNKNGDILKFVGEREDGKYVVSRIDGEKQTLVTKDKFREKFMSNGTLTSRENTEDINRAEKEAGKENNNSSIRSDKSNIKTSAEKIVSKNNPTPKKNTFDIEPSNEESKKQLSNKTKDNYKSKNPLALAWSSFNNTEWIEKKKEAGEEVSTTDELSSNYLESRENKLVGTEVELTVSDEIYKKYNSLKTDEQKQKYLIELINNAAIKVTLNDGSDVETYMHLPTYNSKVEGYTLNMATERQKALEAILKSPTGSVYSTITSKGPGSIQKGEDNQNIKSALQEDNSNKIIILNRGEDGMLYSGKDEKGNPEIDNDFQKNPSAVSGAIYVKVPKSNGEPFPMRVWASNFSEAQANLIVDIYLKIWDKNVNLANRTILKDAVSELDLSDELVKKLIDAMPNGMESTVEELLNTLVYEGKSTNGSPYALYREGNNIKFGENNSPMSFIKSNKNGARDEMVKWLKDNKIHNISFDLLNNKAYKDYLLDNNILTTDSKANSEGIAFIQPTLTISGKYNNKPANEQVETTEVIYDLNGNPIEVSSTPEDMQSTKDLPPQGVEMSQETIDAIIGKQPAQQASKVEAQKADVILPIGTSGSGKSTFIKSLPQENLVVIEPDAMRVEFTGDINDKSKDKEIYEEAAKRAVTAIKQGKQVVFDTTNLTKDKRLPFIEAIKKAIPTANIQYKLMELNPELAKQRIKADIAAGKNRANVPDSTIDRHAESYKQMLKDIKSEPISEFKTNEEINANLETQPAQQTSDVKSIPMQPDDVSVSVTESQVKNVISKIKKSKLGAKLTADIENEFYISYRELKNILGEEQALLTAEKKLINDLENCK